MSDKIVAQYQEMQVLAKKLAEEDTEDFFTNAKQIGVPREIFKATSYEKHLLNMLGMVVSVEGIL